MENLRFIIEKLNITQQNLSDYLEVDKSYISKIIRHRNIKKDSKFYNKLKVFLLKNYSKELSDILNVKNNSLDESLDNYFFKNNKWILLNKVFEYKKTIYISITSNQEKIVLDWIENILKRVDTQKLVILLDKNNIKINNFIYYRLFNYIMKNVVEFYKISVPTLTSFIYAPNHAFLILENYKNKSFIKEIPLDYEFNQIIKSKIKDSILTGVNPISTIQPGIAFLLDKKITKNMSKTKQPVYFVSHPHFSILNNELLEKIIDNNKIQGALKDKIISLEKEKDDFDKIVIYCTKDSLIYKDGFSPSGLSIFLKSELKFNKNIYIDYIKLLKQKNK